MKKKELKRVANDSTGTAGKSSSQRLASQEIYSNELRFAKVGREKHDEGARWRNSISPSHSGLGLILRRVGKDWKWLKRKKQAPKWKKRRRRSTQLPCADSQGRSNSVTSGSEVAATRKRQPVINPERASALVAKDGWIFRKKQPSYGHYFEHSDSSWQGWGAAPRGCPSTKGMKELSRFLPENEGAWVETV